MRGKQFYLVVALFLLLSSVACELASAKQKTIDIQENEDFFIAPLTTKGDKIVFEVKASGDKEIDVYLMVYDEFERYKNDQSFEPMLTLHKVPSASDSYKVTDEERYFLVVDNRNNVMRNDAEPTGDVTVTIEIKSDESDDSFYEFIRSVVFYVYLPFILIILGICAILLFSNRRLKQERERVRTNLAKIKTRHNALFEENRKTTENLSRLEKDIQVVVADKEIFRREINKHQEYIQKAEEDNDELKDEIGNLRKELEESLKELEDKRDDEEDIDAFFENKEPTKVPEELEEEVDEELIEELEEEEPLELAEDDLEEPEEADEETTVSREIEDHLDDDEPDEDQQEDDEDEKKEDNDS